MEPDKKAESESLLERLTKQNETGKTTISCYELINNGIIDQNNKDDLKELFDLIISEQLHTTFNSRSLQEVAIVVNKGKNKDANPDELNLIIDSYCLFLAVSPTNELNCFHEYTRGNFINHPIFKNGEIFNLSSMEWEILMRTAFGYLTGYHPVYFTDMKLNANQIIEYTLLLETDKALLKKNDLLKFITDSDGVSVRVSINKKTMAWMTGRESENNMENQIISNPLFNVIKPENIKKIDLVYNDHLSQVFNDLSRIINSNEQTNDINLSVLLHGPSGTGKTAFVHQLASDVNATVIQMEFSQIHSKWIGETEKNVKTVFDEYTEIRKKSKQPVILFINEADGLINKRVYVNTSNDIFSNQVQTQLLELLENFKGIIIATTNLISHIDSAFNRRFLFKLKVDNPDISMRKKLLNESYLNTIIGSDLYNIIVESQWTAAQLRDVEFKIKLLNSARQLNQEEIKFWLIQDGLINNKKTIGFVN